MVISNEFTYEKAKNNAEGTTSKSPVAILTGLSLEFWNRPPPQKSVLPRKYS
jgi:hypothetical protein